MEIIKNIFRAIVAYNGSSENPAKTSARFSAIIIGGIAALTPVIDIILGFVPLPEGVSSQVFVNSMSPVIDGFIYVYAGMLYLFGMARALITAAKTKNIGALVGANNFYK